jgi:hypothetical protein
MRVRMYVTKGCKGCKGCKQVASRGVLFNTGSTFNAHASGDCAYETVVILSYLGVCRLTLFSLLSSYDVLKTRRV